MVEQSASGNIDDPQFQWLKSELDADKRLVLVAQIQKRLEEEAPRPIMGWRVDRFAHHPYVKNLIPHNVVYNCCRLQDTWLDK